MRIATGDWVLVADGEKFLMLENQGDSERVDLRVIQHKEIDNPPTREQGAERPGRIEDPGHGHSTVEQTDWHRIGKERFAGDLAEHLRLLALKDRFKGLVIVADPRTLGVLRPLLHKAVAERVTGEINKDLTSLPIDAIEASLAAA